MTAAVIALAAVALAALAYAAWQQREGRAEREQLMQRIQDPERAVEDYARATRVVADPPPRARIIALDDDDAMGDAIAARERREVTDGGTD